MSFFLLRLMFLYVNPRAIPTGRSMATLIVFLITHRCETLECTRLRIDNGVTGGALHWGIYVHIYGTS